MAKKNNAQEMLDFARELAPSINDAYSFHNALFGIHGKFGKLFPTQEEREAFIKTDEYQEIKALQAEVESRKIETVNFQVRVPKGLHEQLKQEVEAMKSQRGGKMSLNDLCILKLSAPVESLV